MNVKDIWGQQALGKSMCSTLTLINAKGSSSHSREITGGGASTSRRCSDVPGDGVHVGEDYIDIFLLIERQKNL